MHSSIIHYLLAMMCNYLIFRHIIIYKLYLNSWGLPVQVKNNRKQNNLKHYKTNEMAHHSNKKCVTPTKPIRWQLSPRSLVASLIWLGTSINCPRRPGTKSTNYLYSDKTLTSLLKMQFAKQWEERDSCAVSNCRTLNWSQRTCSSRNSYLASWIEWHKL